MPSMARIRALESLPDRRSTYGAYGASASSPSANLEEVPDRRATYDCELHARHSLQPIEWQPKGAPKPSGTVPGAREALDGGEVKSRFMLDPLLLDPPKLPQSLKQNVPMSPLHTRLYSMDDAKLPPYHGPIRTHAGNHLTSSEHPESSMPVEAWRKTEAEREMP
eukprot:gene8131-9662_t